MNPRAWIGAAAIVTTLVFPQAAFAQSDEMPSVGIGPRLTFVRGSGESTEGSQRFSGGVIRFGGGKTAIEIAMDYRAGVTGNLTERIKDYPIQGSLLVFPVRGKVAPYLLGGVGWYTQSVTTLPPGAATANTPTETETTRRLGYHGGFGGEIRVHRRVGFYGDYRYTFIRFGGQDVPIPQAPSPSVGLPGWIPGSERLRMSHEGSMFTWGATFYF